MTNQIIPETDNIEVAKIAAALAMAAPTSGDSKEKILNFARAYKFVCQIIGEGQALDLAKLLETLKQGN